MAGLKGRYDARVDAKGRVSIPSKCRKLLPEQLVITKSPNKELPALVVYSEVGFEEWFDKLLLAKGGEKVDDELQDQLIDEYCSAAQDVVPDDLGRITIPPFLRAYAGIKNQVVITGSRDHLIIRTPEVMAKYEQRFASNSVYDKSDSSDKSASSDKSDSHDKPASSPAG